jgi:hypothetical protein
MAQPCVTTILAVLLVSAPIAVHAQDTASRELFVTVTDGAGAPILDLQPDEFEVVENGAPRTVTRARLADAPMRIVLLVDSSSAVAQMLPYFRKALTAFVDALPPEHEVAFITSGGQLRIRAQPDADRQKLRSEAGRFASFPVGNAFVDTLIEADRRFLEPAGNRWPVFVIVTTDSRDARGDPRVRQFNTFFADFIERGGTAHGVVVKGSDTGMVTEFTQHLANTTGGFYEELMLPNALPQQLEAVAKRLADDHRRMSTRYAIEFATETGLEQPRIEVGVRRQGAHVLTTRGRTF